MNLQQNLQTTGRELDAARLELDKAVTGGNREAQSAAAQQIAALEAQRAAILARIEAERKAADAWNARGNRSHGISGNLPPPSWNCITPLGRC